MSGSPGEPETKAHIYTVWVDPQVNLKQKHIYTVRVDPQVNLTQKHTSICCISDLNFSLWYPNQLISTSRILVDLGSRSIKLSCCLKHVDMVNYTLFIVYDNQISCRRNVFLCAIVLMYDTYEYKRILHTDVSIGLGLGVRRVTDDGVGQ